MKVLYYCILLTQLLLITSCVSEVEKEFLRINYFPLSENIIGAKEILVDEYKTFFIKQIDSLLIISTDTEPFLRFYNEKNEFLLGVGRDGRGPNEFSHVLNFNTYVSKDGLNIIAYDYMLLKLYVINIDKSLASKKLAIDKVIELPRELRGITNIFYINDKEFIGVYDDLFDKKLDKDIGVFLYNYESNSIKTSKIKTIEVQPFDLMASTNLNNSPAAISHDRSKLAVSKIYFPIVEIFDEQLNLLKKIIIGRNKIPVQINPEIYFDGIIETHYKTVA